MHAHTHTHTHEKPHTKTHPALVSIQVIVRGTQHQPTQHHYTSTSPPTSTTTTTTQHCPPASPSPPSPKPPQNNIFWTRKCKEAHIVEGGESSLQRFAQEEDTSQGIHVEHAVSVGRVGWQQVVHHLVLSTHSANTNVTFSWTHPLLYEILWNTFTKGTQCSQNSEVVGYSTVPQTWTSETNHQIIVALPQETSMCSKWRRRRSRRRRRSQEKRCFG